MGRNNRSKGVRRKMYHYPIHDFYCPRCGNRNISLPRPKRQREKFHRKMLYCFTCKKETNHIECATYADTIKFRKNFENGIYKEEQSLIAIRKAESVHG